MKSMKMKSVIAMAAALPLALALVACGGEMPSESASSGAAADGTNGEGSGTSSGEQTLTVWAWDPAFNILALQEAEKIYQRDHPDFKLDIVEMQHPDIQTKITTLALSDTLEELPDIVLQQNDQIEKNLVNYPDVFVSMDDSSVDFSEFPASVLEFSTVDGKNWAVPFDSGTVMNAMRIDVLKEAGYTIEDFTDITWDEYIEKGKDVLEKTGKPLLSKSIDNVQIVMMIMTSFGASIFDSEGNPDLTSDDVKASFEQYKRLVDSGVLINVNSWDEYISSILNGQVAGVINGVWMAGGMQTAEDQSGLWEITNMPKMANKEGATNYSAQGGSSWAVTTSGNHELATDFLASTFAGSVELFDTILPKSGAVTNWIPAGESPAYAEPQPFFNDQPIFEMVVGFGEKVPTTNTGMYFYEAEDILKNVATEYLAGADLDQVLKEAQEQLEFAIN